MEIHKALKINRFSVIHVGVAVLISLSLGFIGGYYSRTYLSSSTPTTIADKNGKSGISIANLPIAEVKEENTDPKVLVDNLKNPDICVEVAGAVMSPGVYCLPYGSRVIDAVNRAGEFNKTAYAFKYVARRLNLSRVVKESEKIYIPFFDDVKCDTLDFSYEDPEIEATNSPDLGITEKPVVRNDDRVEDDSSTDDDNTGDISGQCISVNTASKEELMTISGVGESTAQKIIDARPYTSLEQLLDVSGIGESKYETLLEFVCL